MRSPVSTKDDGSSDDWWSRLTQEERDHLREFARRYRREHPGLIHFNPQPQRTNT